MEGRARDALPASSSENQGAHQPSILRNLCMSTKNPGRIQIHGEGVGELGEEDIEKRARELAFIDGRKEAKEHDRVRAREELLNPGPAPAPEADESERPVELWSKAAASFAHEGAHSELEDEASLAEQLVEEGIEEADREQRLSASEELNRD